MDAKFLNRYALSLDNSPPNPPSVPTSRLSSISIVDRRGYGRMKAARSSPIRCQKTHNEKSVSTKLELSSGNGASSIIKSSSIATTKLQDQMVSPAISTNGRSHEQIEGSIIQNAEDFREIASLVRSTKLKVLERDTTRLPRIETAREFHEDFSKGLGIVEFLKGKKFLITGATGFLAKVLIEKILRTQPEVGKIFLVIKANDYESALQRLKKEVMSSDLFKRIHETYGDQYEEFMMKKLVPVVGDVTRDNLGIEGHIADVLVQEVDIVLNSAANTTFDERYDVALDINTRGISRLLAFVNSCKKLQLFLQISTAYVNGQRQGRVAEKPFQMGDSITREKAQLALHESPPILDIEGEFDLAKKTLEALENETSNLHKSNGQRSLDGEKHVTQAMKALGMERARKYGWQDTYVFSKAMGEMLIGQSRGDLPVVIVRPSVIESTYSDPFPGWMEGNRMMDPIVLYYGKGQLTGFLADTNGVLDVVPADMVVNATLAAMAKHAGKTGLEVYHVASSVVNPLTFGKLAGVLFDHFKSNPYIDPKGKHIEVQKMKLFNKMDDFSDHVRNRAFDMPLNIGRSSPKKISEKRKSIWLKAIEQAKYLANIYQPYTFYKGRFDNSNTEDLFRELSEEEKGSFDFDVKRIEWVNYISKTHIPGLRQHVMKGRGTKMV
eukprot:PITA_00855